MFLLGLRRVVPCWDEASNETAEADCGVRGRWPDFGRVVIPILDESRISVLRFYSFAFSHFVKKTNIEGLIKHPIHHGILGILGPAFCGRKTHSTGGLARCQIGEGGSRSAHPGAGTGSQGGAKNPWETIKQRLSFPIDFYCWFKTILISDYQSKILYKFQKSINLPIDQQCFHNIGTAAAFVHDFSGERLKRS